MFESTNSSTWAYHHAKEKTEQIQKEGAVLGDLCKDCYIRKGQEEGPRLTLKNV